MTPHIEIAHAMSSKFLTSSGGKNLSDLRHLLRSPGLSYLRKQTHQKAPSTVRASRGRFPEIGVFSPSHAWNFIVEYLSHRIGRRHPFQTYATGQPSSGLYSVPDETEIRIALAGDWATGTDEAAAIGNLILDFRPHYSIHLGDVYYV